MPGIKDVTKEGYELKGWGTKEENKIVIPEGMYNISVSDAVYRTEWQMEKIDIKALWAPKTIGSQTVNHITLEGATFTVDYEAYYDLTAQGFMYKETSSENWINIPTVEGNGKLTATVTGLKSGTSYDVKAYLENKTGRIENALTSFKTYRTQSVGNTTVPTTTLTTASFSAPYICDDPALQAAFEYRKATDTQWTTVTAQVNVTTETLTASISGLESDTVYQVRAVLMANGEISRSTVVTDFRTKQETAVGTVAVTGVTAQVATFTVDYVSEEPLVEQGFLYRAIGESGWKNFSATVSGNKFTVTTNTLSSNTTYEVRGYIRTLTDRYEGSIVSFTTPKSSSGGSGSSGGSSTAGSSGSAGGTNTTGDTAAQQIASHILTAIEQGNIPTVVVDGSYHAQVPVEALEAIVKAGQALVVQSGSVGVTFNPQAIKALLGNDNAAPPVQIAMAPIIPTTLEQITQQLIKAEEGTILGGRELTFSLSVNTAKSQDSFVEPLDIQLDLSKLDLKDFSRLTLVRYEIQQDGSVTAVKLGGKYDEKTKSFMAKTGKPGLYGVMAVDSLTQITLMIDHNELELNGKSIHIDVAPEIINGLTMMPLRAIAENLGAEVKWDENLKEAVILLDGKTLVVGKEQGLMIKQKERRTLVPVRYIAENLGANVLWIPSTRQVQIVR